MKQIEVKRENVFQWANNSYENSSYEIKSLDQIKSYLMSNMDPTTKKLPIIYSQRLDYIDKLKVENPEWEMDKILQDVKVKEYELLYRNTKANLPVMWSQCFMDENGKGQININRYNPFVYIDIDKLDPSNVNSLFYQLKYDKYVKLIFKSPSMHGIKILVEIDLPDGLYTLEELKLYHKFSFEKVKSYYGELYNIGTIHLDQSGGNIDRSCIMPTGREGQDIYVGNCDNNEIFETFGEWKSLTTKKTKSPVQTLSVKGMNSDLFEEVLTLCKLNKMAICEDHQEWVALGFLIFKNYGESGGKVFDEYSKLSKKYDPKSVEKQWLQCVKSFDPERCKSEKWLVSIIESLGLKLNTKTATKWKWSEKDYPTFKKELNIEICKDELTNMKYIEEDSKLVQMSDEIENELMTRIWNKYNDKLSESKIKAYMYSRDNITYRNFIKEKLDSILTDDSSDFDNLFQYIQCEEGDQNTKDILLSFCLGSLHNVLSQDYYDDLLVLKGSQGIGKTFFILKLLLSPFSNWVTQDFNFHKIDNKDNLSLLATKMFAYDSENLTFDKSTASLIKNVTSKVHIDVRAPYETHSITRKRIVTFIFDTNQDNIYNDITGGRRYKILTIQNLMVDKNKPNWGLKSINYEKLWGYVYNLYLNGKRHTEIDLTHISTENSRYKSDLEIAIDNVITYDTNSKSVFDEIRSAINREMMRMNKNTYSITDAKIKEILKSKGITNNKSTTIAGKSVRYFPAKIDSTFTLTDMIQVEAMQNRPRGEFFDEI